MRVNKCAAESNPYQRHANVKVLTVSLTLLHAYLSVSVVLSNKTASNTVSLHPRLQTLTWVLCRYRAGEKKGTDLEALSLFSEPLCCLCTRLSPFAAFAPVSGVCSTVYMIRRQRKGEKKVGGKTWVSVHRWHNGRKSGGSGRLKVMRPGSRFLQVHHSNSDERWVLCLKK